MILIIFMILFLKKNIVDNKSLFGIPDGGPIYMQCYRYDKQFRFQISSEYITGRATAYMYEKVNGSWTTVPFDLHGAILDSLRFKQGTGYIDVIKSYDLGTDFGIDILIGGGGNTCIGSGESQRAVYTDAKAGLVKDFTIEEFGENLCLSSDRNIILVVGYQDGYASSKSVILDQNGTFRPTVNNAWYLGSASYKWNQIYSTNAAISTSDIKEKEDISYIGIKSEYDTDMPNDQLIELIMGIKPVIFKRKNGESKRPHHGIISNDFEELINRLGIDHAAFIKSPKYEEKITYLEDGKTNIERKEIPGEYDYGFRYEEIITDHIKFSQLLYEENNKLKETISEQNTKISSLENELQELKNMVNSLIGK